MELKNYQKKVIEDLTHYLDLINETHHADIAFAEFWKEKGVILGENGIAKYNNTIKNTPHICFKVPTGGGKTFLAANALKPVIDSMPPLKTKAVVWLVPSDAILEQTLKTLQNPDHSYRQTISRDFGGRLEVYTKQQLLTGQNFNPTSVREQLSIFVLSYDSLRSAKKDGRKIYQENGNLAPFPKYYTTPETLVEGTDDTALIQVINQLSPVIIVDESHHAISNLSVEMLNNLNPSFVIDLTATPKKNSNILSYVEAIELKRENMVKLPVILYNKVNKNHVVYHAIDLRKKLEEFAKEEQKKTGIYIRPIVLFQAEPKGKEDNTTFEKIKTNLIDARIPEDQIAIKTAKINEIKNIDLLSPSCKIRYIITINALKEGWDCPFAYILATVANRSSKVDVEQIVGRILRQPYTRQHINEFLNLSYVFTSSDNFQETIDNILKGLNSAGFSKHDYRIAENSGVVIPEGQSNIEHFVRTETEDEDEEDEAGFNPQVVLQISEEQKGETAPLSDSLTAARAESEKYNEKVAEVVTSTGSFLPSEVRDKMQKNPLKEKYQNELETFCLPKFYIKTESSFFSPESKVKLTKEQLGKDFTLKGKATDINFNEIKNEMGRLDIEDENSSIPKYQKLSERELKYFKANIAEQPREATIREAKKILHERLNRIDNIDSDELKVYLNQIVENMAPDQLAELQVSTNIYAVKIKNYIGELLEKYRDDQFKKLSDSGRIFCEETYRLKPELPLQNGISSLSKSLYQIEDNMNQFEREVIQEVASFENIEWWHRNIEKREFFINGFINHYPDFIVKTKEGKIILLETKGDYLDNADSEKKARLGCIWQSKAGDKYLYYMVYENNMSKLNCVYSFSEFKDIIRDVM